MSALSSIEMPVAGQAADAAARVPESKVPQRRLRLVTEPGPDGLSAPAAALPARLQPRSSSIMVTAGRPLAGHVLTPTAVIPPRSPVSQPRPPVRLTRRGSAVGSAADAIDHKVCPGRTTISCMP